MTVQQLLTRDFVIIFTAALLGMISTFVLENEYLILLIISIGLCFSIYYKLKRLKYVKSNNLMNEYLTNFTQYIFIPAEGIMILFLIYTFVYNMIF